MPLRRLIRKAKGLESAAFHELKDVNLCLDPDIEILDLRDQDLSFGDFSGQSLPPADCTNTNFSHSSMKHTDAAKLYNLNPTALSGSDLYSAKIPEYINFNLDSLNEYVKNCRNIFFSLLIICSYIILTAISTNDVDLLTGSRDFLLPVVNTEISLPGFYLVGPLLIILLAFFFYVNVSSLFNRLSKLPAIFPNGNTIDEMISPWVVTELMRARMPRLRHAIDYSWWLRVSFGISLAWLVVPISLLVIWLSYLKRHEEILTNIHVLLINVGVVLSIYSFLSCLNIHNFHRFSLFLLAAAVLIVVFFPLWYVSNLITHGKPVPDLVAQVIKSVGYSPNLSLTGAVISSRPDNWTPGLDADYGEVTGANLTHASLRNAQGRHVFLARANLTQADLTGAVMPRGRFQFADFTGASAIGAKMPWASFRGAHFHGSDFSDAVLSDAVFESAILKNANFQKAILTSSRIVNSDLEDANFRGAYLMDAQIHGSNLRKIDLVSANLYNAIIAADLSGAMLAGADLRRADLSKSSGLSTVQVESACLDTETKLPPAVIWSGRTC